MRWTDTAKKFLGAFASKDVVTIESLLDEDVRLIYWSCDVKGIDDTVNAIENFFDFVKNIKIHIITKIIKGIIFFDFIIIIYIR